MTMKEPSDDPDTLTLSGLRSVRSTYRLNQIDHIRGIGVGDHISLPQLAVFGDQSAGKSSVLEGVTGIPFPRQDGLCTKFATEIILRHNPDLSQITATVIPHSSRPESEKERFQSYHRIVQGFSDLPQIIAEAGALMKIRGHGDKDTPELPAFAADVLRIEVIGDTGLHLTVVDLPGLIAVANEEQTEEDVNLVAGLVDTYLESSRTIILAVVQANNDIANQGIIQRARKFDKAGQRTVGIITKPDLINEGTQGRIALLAKNQDTTKLSLGYFLLKNPSPVQLEAGISLSERKRIEMDFFTSNTWKSHQLDMSRVGIDNLRSFLQDLLDKHIEKELPKVQQEIKKLLLRTETELVTLGEERPTVNHMRMFLTRLSMKFHNITQAALYGSYHEAHTDFFDNAHGDLVTRLRAEVHRVNGEFAAYMRVDGMKRKLTGGSDGFMSDSDCESEQILVTKHELDGWVKKVYKRTRGRELPGNYNHVLLSELFHEQSSRWKNIASGHVLALSNIIEVFINGVLDNTIEEEHVKMEIKQLTAEKLELVKSAAKTELQKLINDEKRQPITYNHYYTDNIQHARQDAMKALIQKAMTSVANEDWNGKLHVSNTHLDSSKLLASLQNRVVVNMDDQACVEALAGLNAYYKVAMKTFVDNVCRQVIERHLLSDLPEIFSPPTVMSLSDEDLQRIASEPLQQQDRRASLSLLVQKLTESLVHLRK